MTNKNLSFRQTLGLIGTLLSLSLWTSVALAGDKAKEKLSDQRMATSPAQLIKLLSDVSFMSSGEYTDKYQAELNSIITPLNIEPLKQTLDEATDPRRDIKAEEIQTYIDKLTNISLQSKRDGELLWGRIQGTKYERQASEWAENKLKDFGFSDVRKDRIPARRLLWRLDELELTITEAPSFKKGKSYPFKNALTAYQSANTPEGGIEAEVIYVGEGTAAELQGRDLTGKIALVRSRGLPGSLFHSGRTAFSRVVAGEYGKPAGVIMWSDVPGASQVAARVGSTGGGEIIGLAAPWTTISNDDGYYLRKLLDRATPKKPVKVRLNVQGVEEGPDVRYSYNIYGVLPGKSGKYILHLSHLDAFLYGIHCNAGSVAMNLALAKHYAKLPEDQREHGHIFLFVGDHENPGVGATDVFRDKNKELVDNLLLIMRPEKIGMVQRIDEGWVNAATNMPQPGLLMITNRSPLLLELFKQAAVNYSIATGDFYYTDPAADEVNFHPPYYNGGVISAGWATGTRYYHSTADGELNMISSKEVEKMARAHAFVIDSLAGYSKEDIEKGGVPYGSQKSIYQSDLLKMLFGNH